jgi:cytochrome c2
MLRPLANRNIKEIGPLASIPDNRMPYAGMPDASDRADLIAYLQKVSKSSPP